MITVGASSDPLIAEGLLTDFSNYGNKIVDLLSPGKKIYSSLPKQQYGFLDGTSMSAPILSHIAALIRSYFPKLSATEVKSILLQTGHAGLDESHAVLPDFTSPNLYTATNFILHDYPRILSLIERFNIKIALGSFVFIGGLSRSGKSIFANCLKYSLLEKGMSAKVISIDGWLKKDRYKAAENVLERYDIASIKELIHAIHSAELPMKLEIPIYLKKTSSTNTVEYIDYVDNKTVFIFEGTIALYLSDITKDIPKSSIYVDVDEESRSSRVIEEYKIRGMSPKEAMKIYQSRQLDEAALIINSRLFAEHFINLNLAEKLK
jgi:uridine kinase